MHAHRDVLIVGGGSAGCVLAARLSEDGARRVTLLEAGPLQPAALAAAAVRNGHQPAVLPGLNWKYRCAVRGDDGAGRFDYEAGRLLGGSSAVNAAQALRGAPADYDGWAQDCGEAWSWHAVLPWFRRLEDDPLGPSPLHGRCGPMPIRRDGPAALRPLQAALAQACPDQGFAATPDLNDPATTGVGMLPRNVVGGERISAAAAYLGPALQRNNLEVIGDAQVHALLWRSDERCRGVRAEVGGRLQELPADVVVLCAGVLATPTLLMRSGVGAPAALLAHGIAPRLPLAGVGENLMEHPVIGLWGVPAPGACVPGEPMRQVLLRCSSGRSPQADDLHLCMVAGLDMRQVFPRVAEATGVPTLAGLTVCFNRPASRGHVRLGGADLLAAPRVTLNCLGDPADGAALREGLGIAWALLQRPALRRLFDRLLAWDDGLLRSPRALAQAVQSFVRPAAHLCGTARMGSSPDGGAVVDPQGRLHGTRNVYVADASVMPCIPSAPPHLSVLMVAEKIAASMVRGVR